MDQYPAIEVTQHIKLGLSRVLHKQLKGFTWKKLLYMPSQQCLLGGRQISMSINNHNSSVCEHY